MAKQPKTCQQCGHGPLYWTQVGVKADGKPAWMLQDPTTGNIHKCGEKGETVNRLQMLDKVKALGVSVDTARQMDDDQLAEFIKRHGGNANPEPFVYTPPTPAPHAGASQVPSPVNGDAGAALWAIIAPHAGAVLDADKLKATVYAAVEELLPKPTTVVVKHQDSGVMVNVGKVHKKFPLLVKLAGIRTSNGSHLNIALSGPAGSFKTDAAERLAKALRKSDDPEAPLDFYPVSVGPQTSESKLVGFANAAGVWTETPVYRAFKFGGVLLLDELDAGNPGVLTVINALLSNGHYMFGTERVERHTDFLCLSALNTWGGGADTEYVGRLKMDAASRNRWTWVEWDYDEELERELWGTQLAWVRYVQAVRKAARNAGIRIVVSPRASQRGSAQLDAGIDRETVEAMELWAGVDADTKRKVVAAM